MNSRVNTKMRREGLTPTKDFTSKWTLVEWIPTKVITNMRRDGLGTQRNVVVFFVNE